MSRFDLDIGTCTTESAVDCASILEREGYKPSTDIWLSTGT